MSMLNLSVNETTTKTKGTDMKKITEETIQELGLGRAHSGDVQRKFVQCFDGTLNIPNTKEEWLELAKTSFVTYWHLLVEKSNNTIPALDLSGQDLRKMNFKHKNLSGANFTNANLCFTNFAGAILENCDFTNAESYSTNYCFALLNNSNFNNANLCGANLSRSWLKNVSFEGAQLNNTNLKNADLSGVTGLLSAFDWLCENFERTSEGFIVYKIFHLVYPPPQRWNIKPGGVITETVATDRSQMHGCGVNFGTKKWVTDRNRGLSKKIWECLLPFESLIDCVVPYGTEGRARCGKLVLLRVL